MLTPHRLSSLLCINFTKLGCVASLCIDALARRTAGSDTNTSAPSGFSWPHESSSIFAIRVVRMKAWQSAK